MSQQAVHEGWDRDGEVMWHPGIGQKGLLAGTFRPPLKGLAQGGELSVGCVFLLDTVIGWQPPWTPGRNNPLIPSGLRTLKKGLSPGPGNMVPLPPQDQLGKRLGFCAKEARGPEETKEKG